MWENRALEQLLLLSRSVDDDAQLAVMASRFGHTPVPLVQLTTIIQQQKAHASIVGNYAAQIDNGKSDAHNGISEQYPDMGVIYCSGFHTGYAVDLNALRTANQNWVEQQNETKIIAMLGNLALIAFAFIPNAFALNNNQRLQYNLKLSLYL